MATEHINPLASSRIQRGFLLVLQTDFDEEEDQGDIYPVWASLRVDADLLAFLWAKARVCVDNELILAEVACEGTSHGFLAGERPADSALHEWRLRCSATGFSLAGTNLEIGVRVDTAPLLFEDLAIVLAHDCDAVQNTVGRTGWLGPSLLVAYEGTGGLLDMAKLLLCTRPETAASYREHQISRCLEASDGQCAEATHAGQPRVGPAPPRRRPRV